MSNYQRLISYIYAYEGEIKGKNIGFAKLETRNGQCRITVNVKKIYVGGNPIGVYLLSSQGEVKIGTIFARNGAGEFRAVVNASNVENSGLGIERFYGLSVHDVESSWQSYTTIWEDAVAHAAEIELADITSENRMEQEGGKEEEESDKEPYKVSREIEEELKEEEQRIQQEEQEERVLPARETNTETEVPPDDHVEEQPEQNSEPELSVFPGIQGNSGRDNTRQGRGMKDGRERNPFGRIRRILEPISEFASMPEPAHSPVPVRFPVAPDASSELKTPASPEQVKMPPEIQTPHEEPWIPGAVEEEPKNIPEMQPVQPEPEIELPEAQPKPEPELPGIRPEPGIKLPEAQPEPEPEQLKVQPETEAVPPFVPGQPSILPEMEPQPQPGTESRAEQERADTPGRRWEEPSETFRRNEEVLRGFDEEDKGEYSHQRVWERLRKMYPKVEAFDYDNDSEILMIKPQDIGLLPRETWVYGNNSFLLHGYYNYRYLILAKLENPQGKTRYLLGIPGHYYSNEKYMAAMFGFPNFVLAKEQPPKDVRFGYWYTDISVGE